MKIRLLDYANVEHFVEIQDDTEVIRGQIISGDMVMTYPFRYDTGANTRRINYYDGEFVIEAKDFEKLNTIKSSYDVCIWS
jgi:hypothetical protein